METGNSLPAAGTTTNGFAGFSGDIVLWTIIIAVALVVGYMLLSSLGRDRYSGTKGGRVKKSTIEYDDEDVVEEEEVVHRDRI